ncbi:hypothetical protein AAP_00797 [Ascosphaera apis ARSEF 7405]|uniref:Uncharacterized protein n=1 Tax=Ascosphaera apis ARSEF 7405 TaxID=392613 RepID=A0A168CYA8_9EURO|nr:hypothetical protein AAP_00797 [Ascosphaera apis ARSEF 7405]
MAFQAPAHLQRTPFASDLHRSRPHSVRGSQPVDRHSREDDDETDEWVLFSPTDKTEQSLSIIEDASNVQRQHSRTSTIRTPLTHTLSRISDLESWNDYEPLPRTGQLLREAAGPGEREDRGEKDGEEDIESTELDSLDDGLHAFNEPLVLRPSLLLASDSFQDPLQHSIAPILPAHDGLGSFVPSGLQQTQDGQRSGTSSSHLTASSAMGVKEDDYVSPVDHVEYNDINVAPPPAHDDPQRDRWQRIEDWRMEQGRALLAELEKEIRRQRRLETKQALKATDSLEQPRTPDYIDNAGDSGPHESAWHRVTRRFIHDIIGIDEDLLAILFGDSFSSYAAGSESEEYSLSQKELVEELDRYSVDSSGIDDMGISERNDVLDRIAKELGILVHHFYEENPLTFSTYASYSSGTPGVPYDEHMSQKTPRQAGTEKDNSASRLYDLPSPADIHLMAMPSPNLFSTLNGKEEGLEDRQMPEQDDDVIAQNNNGGNDRSDHEFWEQKLSVTMIFQFLISRFSGSSPHSTKQPSKPTAPDFSRQQSQREPHDRAEVIRKVHPLVPQAQTAQNQIAYPSIYYSHAHLDMFKDQSHYGPLSVCGSVSRLSANAGASSSSRPYWDLDFSSPDGTKTARATEAANTGLARGGGSWMS